MNLQPACIGLCLLSVDMGIPGGGGGVGGGGGGLMNQRCAKIDDHLFF